MSRGHNKDIEMCSCKTHLHAFWFIESLMKSAKKRNIPISLNSYNSFFDYLTQDCSKGSSKWFIMKGKLLKAPDPAKIVPLMHFVLLETTSKKGKLVKNLKNQVTSVNMLYILDFLSELLSDIINHRESLRQCQASIKTCYNSL